MDEQNEVATGRPERGPGFCKFLGVDEIDLGRVWLLRLLGQIWGTCPELGPAGHWGNQLLHADTRHSA